MHQVEYHLIGQVSVAASLYGDDPYGEQPCCRKFGDTVVDAVGKTGMKSIAFGDGRLFDRGGQCFSEHGNRG